MKTIVICGLLALLPSCSTPKSSLSTREREFIETQAMEKWEETEKQLKEDGYGKYDSDGTFIWSKNIKKKRLKVLNREKLKK